jgi:hypothetical protein
MRNVREALQDRHAVELAMARAAEAAFQQHSWTGVPMAIWKDGRVVLIDPNAPSEDIPKGFRPPRTDPPRWGGL